jgi:hypothetical protein
MKRLGVNGDFYIWEAWKNTPGHTGKVTYGVAGAGYTLPEGYGGGAGPGGVIEFSRQEMPTGFTGVRSPSRYFGSWKWTSAVTVGGPVYPGTNRLTYIEQTIGEWAEYAAGEVWTFSFDGWCDGAGPLKVVPIIYWGMANLPWAAGKVKKIGDYLQQDVPNNSPQIYKAVSAGTTGSVPPTHMSGTASDGGVSWLYVGPFKGRSHEIYESGPGAHAGIVYPATGMPNDGAMVELTPNPKRFSVDIALPRLGTGNLIPPQDYIAGVGGGAMASRGFDLVDLPQAGTGLNLHNIECRNDGCNRFIPNSRFEARKQLNLHP